jgi:hypothetical protein
MPAMPATAFDREGKWGAAPFPSNGNQPDRGSLASLTAPAPPRQIPAAPSPPLFAPRAIFREKMMEQDNRESWLNRVAIGMAPLFDALDMPDRRAWADAI